MMAYHNFTYENVLASSLRAQWELDDVLAADQELDFSRDLMPDALVGIDALDFLDANQKRTLNHICAYQYLHYFGQIEELILPFVLDHARPMLNQDDFRVRALLNFASEEAKHIHLFNRFKDAFRRGFPGEVETIKQADLFQKVIFERHPLAIGLAVLMIEWMTQAHYLDSIRDDDRLDPLFKSLLKNHWIEEAQHAKMDTLIVDAIVEQMPPKDIGKAFADFFQIIAFLDRSLARQAALNVLTFEQMTGGQHPQREAIHEALYQAAVWTYLGTGLTHANFKQTVAAISPRGVAAIQQMLKNGRSQKAAAAA